ncbi:MAG: hypothetical protein K9M12_02020 [Candidatus Pacebacteria bacterium]|nr:hypothetical protein [Candidatus Paceibacterota bacterium]
MNGKIIAVLAFVLIAGGGAYFYMSDGNGTPEEEVVGAWQNMAEVESLTMDIDLLLSFLEPESGEEFNGSATISSDIDKTNEKAKMVISSDLEVQGMTMNLGGEFVFVEDDLYGKINSLPTALLYEFGLADIASEVMGKDILLLESVSENIEEVTTDEISEERAAEIMEEVSTKAFDEGVVILTEAGEEKVNGKNATKYEMKVDYEKVSDFLMELTEDYKDDFTTEEERLMVVAGIEEFKEEFNNLSEEDKQVLEAIKMNIYSDGKHIVRFETLVDVEEQETTMELVFTFGNFNEEFEINAPEEYVKLEDIINDYMMNSFMMDEEAVYPEDMYFDGEELTDEEVEQVEGDSELVE